MRFAEIQGNEGVKRALAGMVDAGKVPHAILFHEDDGCGAVPMCVAFLQYLWCPNRGRDARSEPGMTGLPGMEADETSWPARPAIPDSCGACPACNKISKLIHPDVHFVYPVTGGSLIPSSAKPTSLSYVKQWRELVLSNPFFTERELNEALGIEGKSSLISVADAREILGRLAFQSLEGGWRAVVVYLPEKMNAEAANRLLKSIEEPPERTLFLLVTHAPEKVLPTIASRCQHIRLVPVRRPDAAPGEDEAEELELMGSLLESVTGRDLYSALETGEAIAALPSRERIKAFLKYASRTLRNIFLVQQGLTEIAGASEEELALARRFAPKLKRSFSRTILPQLDRGAMLVDRNVNAKIVACDLVNKMFVS
jgi:DNA polymerase-3 subunit delta'